MDRLCSTRVRARKGIPPFAFQLRRHLLCALTNRRALPSNHQNIVDLIEVIIDGTPTPGRLSTVALVFEYLDHDLSGLLDTPEAANQITPALAKSYMMQLAAGVSRGVTRGSVLELQAKKGSEAYGI